MSIKDVKTNFIVDQAIALFLEKSLNEVTIRDIAERAEVGEATIYRYFSTKENLVCAAAAKLEKNIFDEYFNLPQEFDGFTRLSVFYGQYLKIFKERRELFKFINEFDAYMLGTGKTDGDEYSLGLEMFKTAFYSAYEQGVKDGSIKAVPDWEIFYYATTHATLELCKKLSAANIVIQDISARKEEEISALTELILYRLRK